MSTPVSVRDVFMRLNQAGQVTSSDQALISTESLRSLCREARARGGSLVADDFAAYLTLPRLFGSHLHRLIFERTYP